MSRPSDIRTDNRSRIIQELTFDSSFSRADLADSTGLSRTTVSAIVNRLIDQGIVSEVDELPAGRHGGRKKKVLAFNPTACLAVGLEVDRESCRGMVVSLPCSPLKQTEVAVIDRSLEGVIDLIARVVEDLTSEYPDNAFLGCGVAFPGVVDAVKGVVRLSTHFDWRDVPLRDKLASRLKKPTLIIDRPRAAIVGEKWYGAAKEAKDVIYIHIGTGIGAAFLIDGELHNGFTNTAGEIGHISIDPNGPPCRCGSKGCLELLASGQAIASRTMDRLRTGRSSILREWIDATGEAVTAKMVQTAVEQNDALALEVLEEAGGYLGIAIAMIINLLNPELVLIGGPVARFGEALLEPIRRTVKQRALSVPGSAARILISQLEPDAEQVGAAALLIQQVFGPSKQRLIVSGAHQALFI